MAYALLVRPFLKQEEDYLRKKDVRWRQLHRDTRLEGSSSPKELEDLLSRLVGPLSVMGAEIHHDCLHLDPADDVAGREIWVGDGQSFWDHPGPPKATGGEKISAKWRDPSTVYAYVLGAATKRHISYFYEPHYALPYLSTLYFERRHERAFVEGFRYVDSAIQAWWDKRSTLSRWFGESYMDGSGVEAQAIGKRVLEIMAKAK